VAPTVELVREAAAVLQHHALASLARKQQVQGHLAREPGHIHRQSLPGEDALARREAGDGEPGGQVHAARGVAGVDQGVADSRQADHDAHGAEVRAKELQHGEQRRQQHSRSSGIWPPRNNLHAASRQPARTWCSRNAITSYSGCFGFELRRWWLALPLGVAATPPLPPVRVVTAMPAACWRSTGAKRLLSCFKHAATGQRARA
jgi:hypothetical protein